jgi:hypothetical protein
MKRTKIKFGCGHTMEMVVVPPNIKIALFGEFAAVQRATIEVKADAKKQLCEQCEVARG